MDRYRYSEIEQAHMEKSMVPFAIYQFLNKRVVTVVLSAGFREIFGYDDIAEAYFDMDNNMYKDTHPEDAARIADAAYRFAVEGGKYDVIYRTFDRKAGHGYKIIHAQGVHIFEETGERLAQVWYTDEGNYEGGEEGDMLLNRSLRNAIYEESFIRATSYDSLTGLPAMTYFFELAAEKRASVPKDEDPPAILFMDFSGMKYYNHKYGFAQGDKLLQAFGRLLAQHFGNENCCRLGQDHFVVMTGPADIENRLQKLFDECARINDGCSLPLHVGIYLNWYDGIVVSMASDRAKVACDTLRNEYSSGFSYYNLSMKDAEDRQQYIIANLDKAISERWIKVYYQPIVRAVNGRVCDEEALARWIDPVKGMLPPCDFIPILEDHRLIYKLDLYVVENVLQKINVLTKAGLHIMPQSVNLSRSDFDCCDIVEEIRRRVDESGISRSMLTIEITESTVGKDFDFMHSQIDRFRELGFAVWMDDFGSGYSSLDVLQNIRFDLIKFDMRFMQQFNNGDRGRIILTELLDMATALGIETICEGVETEEQVRFLCETGCTKLQGYYFTKPIPVEAILDRYAKGIQIGFENPEEQSYFEALGRVNLYDLSVIAQENSDRFGNFFNTLPMAIIEVSGGLVRFTRSNSSYRDFMSRYFGITVNDKLESFHNRLDAQASPFMAGLIRARDENGIVFVDENLPCGTTVYSCMRRIAMNEVNGTYAVVVAALSVTQNDLKAVYANIAKALAADYFHLIYVDIDTEKYYEYTSDVGDGNLIQQRQGDNFFARSREDAKAALHPEDVDGFVKVFTKENVLHDLTIYGSFMITYRLKIKDQYLYVNLKASRLQDDPGHLIIGVNNVDAQMRQDVLLERVRRSESIFQKIMALSGNYFSIYSIDPETGRYVTYNASEKYRKFALSDTGDNIFEAISQSGLTMLPEESRRLLKENFTKEKVMAAVRENAMYLFDYEVIFAGKVVPVTLKATLVNETDGEKLLAAVCRRQPPQ